MKKKNWILISVVIAIVAYFFYKKKGESSSLENKTAEADADDIVNNAPMPEGERVDNLKKNVDRYDIASTTAKAATWVIMFAVCPYWRGFINDMHDRHLEDGGQLGIGQFYYHIANQFVAAGVHISERFLKCGNTYTREAGSIEFLNVG